MTTMRYLAALFCLVLFAACDNVAPTLTPTRPLSAPTLEASATILPLMSAQQPTQYMYAGQNDPTAASLPRDSELPPLAAGTLAPGETHQPIALTAPDGDQLLGDLYASRQTDVIAPGILLLAVSNDGWLDLPLRLQAQGYNVLAMPLRAGTDANSLTARGDFEAMIDALSQTADPGHLAVVGAETGADVALLGCSEDLLCDAVALLTPTDQVVAQNTIIRFNPRPIFLAVGRDDAASFGIAEFLRGSARGDVGYEPVDGADRGATLLQTSNTLTDRLIEWLGQQLA